MKKQKQETTTVNYYQCDKCGKDFDEAHSVFGMDLCTDCYNEWKDYIGEKESEWLNSSNIKEDFLNNK